MLSKNCTKTISYHEAEDYFDIVGFLNPCTTLVQMYVCLKMNQIKDNSMTSGTTDGIQRVIKNNVTFESNVNFLQAPKMTILR